MAGLLCGCSPSVEKRAGAEYVGAAQKVSAAERAFNAADYSEALALCQEARSDVDSIVGKYPESAIALKVVTDASTRIGPCSYSDLISKVLPELEVYANPTMRNADLCWAIVVNNGSDAALYRFAVLLADNVKMLEISDAELREMETLCISRIKDPKVKSSIIEHLAGRRAAAEVAAQAPKPAQKAASARVSKIGDVKMFIESAKSDASLVSYELRAIDSLREKAKLAVSADPQVRAEFIKILETAYANIFKISTDSVKEKALSNIAVAFSDAGDVVKAIDIAKTLKDPQLFEKVFDAIGSKAGEGKNYVSALGLAAYLKNPEARDSFLSELSGGVARQGLFAEAVEIAKAIVSVPVRNAALAVCARDAFAAGNGAGAVSAVSAMDASSLAFLPVLNADVSKLSGSDAALADALRLADLAKKIMPFSKPLAAALNGLARSRIESSSDFANWGAPSSAICANYIAMDMGKEAAAFIVENIRNYCGANTVSDLCAAAVSLSKTDHTAAERTFAVASEICAQKKELSDGVFEIAYMMWKADIPRDKRAKVLAAFLPKFNKQ